MRVFPQLVAGSLALVVMAACAPSARPGTERVAAPTTLSGPAPEAIELVHRDGPAGRGDTLPPSSTEVAQPTTPETMLATTAIRATTVEPADTPTTAPTIAATIAPTVAPTIARIVVATAPATVPATTPAPTTRRTATTVAGGTAQATPSTSSEPTVAQTTTVAAPATTTPAASSPSSVPSTPSAPGKAVVLGSPCAKRLAGEQRTSKAGVPAVCARTKTGVYRWVRATAPSPTVVAAGAPGFDGRTITLGVIGTTTNPTWTNISKAISAGFEARVAAINRRGGIGGRYPLRIVFRDANYDPTLTVAELNATAGSVIGYGSILGTPATEASVAFLRANQLLASPASQEGRWARESNLLPVFNTYQVQAINGVAYYVEQTPGATVCSVSVATSFGDAGAEGFAFAAADLGARVGASLQMGPADTSPAPILAQLARAGCNGVLTTLAPQQLVQLVMGAARSGLNFRWITVGAGFSDRIITSQTSKVFESTCWVVGDGPVWGDPATQQLAADLIASDNRYWTENPDIGLTFGYTQATVWEAILERAVANGDLSRSGIAKAAGTVGTVNTFAMSSPIDYSQPLRIAAPRASIYAVDGSYRNSVRLLNAAYASPSAARFKLR